jgi:oligopeptide/dipeptide ABC transporter ATP-binding protein
MTSLLEVRDLFVRYPRSRRLINQLRGRGTSWVDVVEGVSFDVRRGETFAIIGESGSGKTSLIMALMGLVIARRGEVHYDGLPVSRDRRGNLLPDRRRIAMMFQDPAGSLSPRMTVRSLLAEPFHIHPGISEDVDAEVHRLLELVGLGDEFAGRYPHQLSGGQARRIGVARALALQPELIIADEPTAGLDVSIQGDVLNLLSDLQHRLGLAMIIVTHNLNIVRHVADRMAIMYLGRFLEQGQSEEIFRHARHPYTRALLSASPEPDPDARTERLELNGEVPSLLARPSGCEFHTRCPFAEDDCTRLFPERTELKGGHEFLCHHPLSDPGQDCRRQ